MEPCPLTDEELFQVMFYELAGARDLAAISWSMKQDRYLGAIDNHLTVARNCIEELKMRRDAKG